MLSVRRDNDAGFCNDEDVALQQTCRAVNLRIIIVS